MTEVVVRISKGKPRLSTEHLAEDTAKVHAAMDAVFKQFNLQAENKDPLEWNLKMVEMYVKELKKRGLGVVLKDPRTK